MSYHGDIRLGDTIDIKFTTRRFSTGAPFTLAGTPAVAAYVGNGTIEITAGITLSVDFDSRAGLNNVRVVATSGNGFATATNVQLVLTAGTVDGVSVAGEEVGSFSIENRSAVMPTTVGRTLAIESDGMAHADVKEVAGTTQTARDLGAQLDAAITTRATPAQVNAEMVDVLNVDTFAEPGQEAPPATTTLVKKIGYLFKAARNRITQTATQLSLFADDATTVDQKATVSDNGITYDRGELGSGP